MVVVAGHYSEMAFSPHFSNNLSHFDQVFTRPQNI